MGYGQGSPQLEDGFARIANEILDALARTSLSDYESRCIHYLWRKTYGWQDGAGDAKKDDIIAYSQWATGTHIDKRAVRRTLQSLENRHIVTKKFIKRPGKNPLIVWAFQKLYQRWKGYNPIQLELRAVAPSLGNEVGDAQTLVNTQVGDKQSPLSYEVGAPSAKVGAVAPPEVGAVAPPTIDNKDTNTIDILPSSKKKLKTHDLYNDAVKAVFEALKTRRGVTSPNPTAEAVAIRWMLKQNFTPGQIIATYDRMKAEPFWSDKGLSMQTVKSQIADKLKPLTSKSKPGRVPTATELDEMAKKKGVI